MGFRNSNLGEAGSELLAQDDGALGPCKYILQQGVKVAHALYLRYSCGHAHAGVVGEYVH